MLLLISAVTMLVLAPARAAHPQSQYPEEEPSPASAGGRRSTEERYLYPREAEIHAFHPYASNTQELPHAPEERKPYNFDYSISDQYSGISYGHNEDSDGSVVRGKYSVLLPDGRLQTVIYTADKENGFLARVEYEGEARFPEHNPLEKKEPLYVPVDETLPRLGRHTESQIDPVVPGFRRGGSNTSRSPVLSQNDIQKGLESSQHSRGFPQVGHHASQNKVPLPDLRNKQSVHGAPVQHPPSSFSSSSSFQDPALATENLKPLSQGNPILPSEDPRRSNYAFGQFGAKESARAPFPASGGRTPPVPDYSIPRNPQRIPDEVPSIPHFEITRKRIRPTTPKTIRKDPQEHNREPPQRSSSSGHRGSAQKYEDPPQATPAQRYFDSAQKPTGPDHFEVVKDESGQARLRLPSVPFGLPRHHDSFALANPTRGRLDSSQAVATPSHSTTTQEQKSSSRTLPHKDRIVVPYDTDDPIHIDPSKDKFGISGAQRKPTYVVTTSDHEVPDVSRVTSTQGQFELSEDGVEPLQVPRGVPQVVRPGSSEVDDSSLSEEPTGALRQGSPGLHAKQAQAYKDEVRNQIASEVTGPSQDQAEPDSTYRAISTGQLGVLQVKRGSEQGLLHPTNIHSQGLSYSQRLPHSQSLSRSQNTPHSQSLSRSQDLPHLQIQSRSQNPPHSQSPSHPQSSSRSQDPPHSQSLSRSQDPSQSQIPPRSQSLSHSQNPPHSGQSFTHLLSHQASLSEVKNDSKRLQDKEPLVSADGTPTKPPQGVRGGPQNTAILVNRGPPSVKRTGEGRDNHTLIQRQIVSQLSVTPKHEANVPESQQKTVVPKTTPNKVPHNVRVIRLQGPVGSNRQRNTLGPDFHSRILAALANHGSLSQGVLPNHLRSRTLQRQTVLPKPDRAPTVTGVPGGPRSPSPTTAPTTTNGINVDKKVFFTSQNEGLRTIQRSRVPELSQGTFVGNQETPATSQVIFNKGSQVSQRYGVSKPLEYNTAEDAPPGGHAQVPVPKNSAIQHPSYSNTVFIPPANNDEHGIIIRLQKPTTTPSGTSSRSPNEASSRPHPRRKETFHVSLVPRLSSTQPPTPKTPTLNPEDLVIPPTTYKKHFETDLPDTERTERDSFNEGFAVVTKTSLQVKAGNVNRATYTKPPTATYEGIQGSTLKHAAQYEDKISDSQNIAIQVVTKPLDEQPEIDIVASRGGNTELVLEPPFSEQTEEVIAESPAPEPEPEPGHDDSGKNPLLLEEPLPVGSDDHLPLDHSPEDGGPIPEAEPKTSGEGSHDPRLNNPVPEPAHTDVDAIEHSLIETVGNT
ncbi:uncharacterized protein LOC143025710 [Oratosquilla oratoria]|uniref:uncharacterized protein LOC143025710 n=1 Tax=Oratosquilla oratoria TaxID=337810 RepID=UPI003F75E377